MKNDQPKYVLDIEGKRKGYGESLMMAVLMYQDRKTGKEKPKGKLDTRKIWWPDRDEEQKCCRKLAHPKERWPFSLRDHCCTAGHIANMFEVEEREVRWGVKNKERLMRIICPPISAPKTKEEILEYIEILFSTLKGTKNEVCNL